MFLSLENFRNRRMTFIFIRTTNPSSQFSEGGLHVFPFTGEQIANMCALEDRLQMKCHNRSPKVFSERDHYAKRHAGRRMQPQTCQKFFNQCGVCVLAFGSVGSRCSGPPVATQMALSYPHFGNYCLKIRSFSSLPPGCRLTR